MPLFPPPEITGARTNTARIRRYRRAFKDIVEAEWSYEVDDTVGGGAQDFGHSLEMALDYAKKRARWVVEDWPGGSLHIVGERGLLAVGKSQSLQTQPVVREMSAPKSAPKRAEPEKPQAYYRNIASKRGADKLVGRTIVEVRGEDVPADRESGTDRTFHITSLVLDNGQSIAFFGYDDGAEIHVTALLVGKPASKRTRKGKP